MIRLNEISFLAVDGLQTGNTSPAACIPGRKVVLLNKPEFNKLKRQQKHFVTLHEIGHLKNYPDTSEISADNYAFTIYATTGRDLGELWRVMLEVLPLSPAKLPPYLPEGTKWEVVNSARKRMQNMYRNIQSFNKIQSIKNGLHKSRRR